MKNKNGPNKKRIIAIVFFVIQALALIGSMLDGGLEELFSEGIAYLVGFFLPTVAGISWLRAAHKEEIAMIEAEKKTKSTLIVKSNNASAQQNVSTLKILRKTTPAVGETTLEELQKERAEIEQRFGELKKVKDLLPPDAYYEAIDALSKEYDEVIAKIKLKL